MDMPLAPDMDREREMMMELQVAMVENVENFENTN